MILLWCSGTSPQLSPTPHKDGGRGGGEDCDQDDHVEEGGVDREGDGCAQRQDLALLGRLA